MCAYLQHYQERYWYPRWRGLHFLLSFAQTISQSHRLHSQCSLLGQTQCSPLWREEDTKGIIQLWITLTTTSKCTHFLTDHAHIYAHTRKHTHADMHALMHTHVCMHTHSNMHTWTMYTHTCTHTHTHINDNYEEFPLAVLIGLDL